MHVHTMLVQVEDCTKRLENTVTFTRRRIEIVRNRHFNRSDLKTIPKWCEMKPEALAVPRERKIRYFFALL